MNQKGFTFVEILVAMAIFVLAVLAAINIARGSVQAATDSKDITQATWLLQEKMVELETQLETLGVEKACEEEKTGKFEEPYERYTWATYCYEVDFRLSETAAQLQQQQAQGEDAPLNRTSENQVLKLILETANKYMADSVRELHVEISWKQGRADRMIDATTHFARYDQQIALPGGLGSIPAADDGGGNQ